MSRKAADPSTDFLGEKAWKAVARQKALDVADYMVGTRLMPGERRQLVDGILGTIGPFYEAAIRDAFAQAWWDIHGLAGEPVEARPDSHPIYRFMWRAIPEDEMKSYRARRH